MIALPKQVPKTSAVSVIFNHRPDWTITVPWPRSNNLTWRQGKNGRLYKCPKASQYQTFVGEVWRSEQVPAINGQCVVYMLCRPKTYGARDLDNVPKSIMDGLTTAGAWPADSMKNHRSLILERDGDGTFDVGEVIISAWEVDPIPWVSDKVRRKFYR